MVQPPKIVKRSVKTLVNLLGILLSVILIVVVASTQDGYNGGGLGAGGVFGGNLNGFGGRCRLDVGSGGVCAFAYILGGLSILLSLLVICLAIVSCAIDKDAPVAVDFTVHAIQAVWWLIGVAVLGTFVSRATLRGYGGEGARVAVVILAVANFILFMASLWTNVCCYIARVKNENVSMYV